MIKSVQADRDRWEIFDNDNFIAICDDPDKADRLVASLTLLKSIKERVDGVEVGEISGNDAREMINYILALIEGEGF